MDRTASIQSNEKTLPFQSQSNGEKRIFIDCFHPPRQGRMIEDSSYAFGYDESDNEWYLHNYSNGKSHYNHFQSLNKSKISEQVISQHYKDSTKRNIPFDNNSESLAPFQHIEQSKLEVRRISDQGKSHSRCKSDVRYNRQMTASCQNPITIAQTCGHSSSRAISLPASHIPRTLSEQQLKDDTAAAEWRDLCMFHRLVGGIRERQVERWSRRSSHSSSPDGMECDRLIEQSIANIVRKHQDSSIEYTEDNHFFCDKKINQIDADFQFSYEEEIPYYDDQEPDDNEDVFTMDF